MTQMEWVFFLLIIMLIIHLAYFYWFIDELWMILYLYLTSTQETKTVFQVETGPWASFVLLGPVRTWDWSFMSATLALSIIHRIYFAFVSSLNTAFSKPIFVDSLFKAKLESLGIIGLTIPYVKD